ncbi:spa2-like domain (SHD) of GIT [Hirsutella rhossiliensis]|uniref:Spa2-like domain (SHD) of GIT n=1 Tax=Hirsutella rhossiliensis TaxID=111463 RepID=A0A9P8SCP2_9HYPO|nr:spa2-like domain (SHD) of GIT [Hirsutella rhossiliensis]KAH0957843.1 spa2-like domain (SHD) of GIT [Hirsutella rhossiliensis]
MSAGGRNAPLSPISVGGSEWSFSSKVPSTEEGGPYPSHRGNLASPPPSGGFNGNMSMNGFPSAPRSNGGPSPPPSIGRSSNGTNMYSARSEGNRNSTRTDIDESVLNEHYLALKTFLNARDANSRQQPNKARDKLLRLSSVQFHELSTDVFDELIRRQATARAPQNAPNGPPNFLLPEKTFHPKRNQARQRLSSLGPPRFRDLAADVFHELERRFPHFVDGDVPRIGSAMSMRGGGPMSRMGTPVNGNMYPPRGQSRMRRPSDASSVRGPPSGDAFGIPPSPGVANGDYGRPMQKQLNQNNTIVPNKSTMLEEDDDNGADEDGADVFGLERVTNESRRNGASGETSEADKKLIQDYQAQVRELQEKLDHAQDTMKKRQEEMSSVLDGERSRATAVNLEKQEWADIRLNLENKLAEAQNLNKTMKQQLDRSSSRGARSANASSELQRDNDELRESLRQQRQVTEEVRREAQEFLREMRALSQQSGATYEKQAEMEKTIENLEREVREWRNRYARTKTQLRNMRASSLGLAMEHDAAKYVRDQGFLDGNGLVKDVHVVKFQTAIDELLHTARKETPDKAIDAMKLVVVSVRRITRDVDESAPNDEELVQQQSRLKAKVSSTANGLITATKNFAGGAGISPVSLVDAAASHLTAAIVDLLRVVKIRTTPSGELEDDDDGTITPVDSNFFSPRSTTQTSAQGNLPPPPPFQGIGGIRASAESSAYSPVSSPRESVERYPEGGANALTKGLAYMGLNKGVSAGYGMQQRGGRADDFKLTVVQIYLDDQTALLVSAVQSLVNCVRGDADIWQITDDVESISATVSKIVAEANANNCGNEVLRLDSSRERLIDASQRGRDLADSGVGQGDRDWRMWAQSLPPIAFDIARETKELPLRVGSFSASNGADEFS